MKKYKWIIPVLMVVTFSGLAAVGMFRLNALNEYLLLLKEQQNESLSGDYTEIEPSKNPEPSADSGIEFNDYTWLPGELQESFDENITRAEFSKLIISMLETVGVEIPENKDSDIPAFTDCADEYVLKAETLGIVTGVGENIFDPSGLLTRGQAAAMLQRTASVLGFTAPNSVPLIFTDTASFPSWFAEAISFVSACNDSVTGSRVMEDTGGGNFNPGDYCTREQAIAAAVRLFNITGNTEDMK